MKTVIKASIAVMAFAVLFVVPSAASAVTLTSPTGTAAGEGAGIQATNVGHANTGSHVLFTTNLGSITCDTATLTGSIFTNGSLVWAEITTAEFKGAIGAHCNSSVGNVTITPSHATNPCHTPTGGSAHCSLPWCMTLRKEDQITIRGGGCIFRSKPLTFTLHTAIAGSCSYQRESVTGTFTTHPGPLVVTASVGQTFTKTTGGGFCPGEGAFDMALLFETDPAGGSPQFVYIDP